MMKSLAVVAAIALVGVQADDGVKNRRDRTGTDKAGCKGKRCLADEFEGRFDKAEPEDNGEGRRLSAGAVDVQRSQKCKGRRCLNDDEMLKGMFDKTEPQENDFGRRLFGQTAEESNDAMIDGGRRLLRRGGHSGRRRNWNRNKGVLMGCNLDEQTDSDNIFGRVSLYHPNQTDDGDIEGVQMRGFFSNLPEEYDEDIEFYVQVVSNATGEEYEFASFYAEDSSWFELKKGNFYYGSDKSDDQMCLGSNCPSEMSAFTHDVQAGDLIELYADLGLDSNPPLGQCTLEINYQYQKEPDTDNDGDSSDEETADEEDEDPRL